MKKAILILILSIIIVNIKSGPILDNLPVTFEMLGPTTYNPDLGGPTLNGYKIRIGYTGHSWIAVQFPESSRSDVLVVSSNDYNNANMNNQFFGHRVFVNDYFYNTTVGLQQDKNITNDISSVNFTDERQYYLTVTRFLGSNGGEDWNAAIKKYTVQKICFYTSYDSFNSKTWNQGINACYHFEIDNLQSTFVGKSLKSFIINGYTAKIYGWIDGPYLSDNVYIFQQSPLFTYKKEPALILELGETSGGYGQDFYVASPVSGQSGDYYGTSVSTIKKDSSMGGFENNGFSARFWNAASEEQIKQYSKTGLRIMFSRNVSTFDDYDKKLSSTFIFCLHIYDKGSINSDVSDKSCEIVDLSYSYVREDFVDQSSSDGKITSILMTFKQKMLSFIRSCLTFKNFKQLF